MKANFLFLVTAFALSLAGCKGKTDAASPPASVEKAIKSQSNKDFARANNHYVEGYDKLIDTNHGLFNAQEAYADLKKYRTNTQRDIALQYGWLEWGLKELKKGQQLAKGRSEEIDKSAEKLITSLNKLVTQLTDLDVYYKSKAHLEDKLAKGKAADAEVEALFVDTRTALTGLSHVMEKLETARLQEQAEKHKSNGKMLQYQTVIAFIQTKELLALIERDANKNPLTDPKITSQADAMVKQIENTLGEQRKAYAKIKDADSRTPSGYGTFGTNLASLIGSYRSYKTTQSDRDYSQIIKNYNNIVESVNDARQKDGARN